MALVGVPGARAWRGRAGAGPRRGRQIASEAAERRMDLAETPGGRAGGAAGVTARPVGVGLGRAPTWPGCRGASNASGGSGRERPPGGEVERPRDVDRVVALVHARRLEVVRDVRARPGWREDAGQAAPRRSAPPRGARGGRCASRAPTCESLRWTITSRSSPIARVERARAPRRRRPARTGRCPAPHRWAVSRQKPSPRVGDAPRAASASAISASSSSVDAEREPAPGRVLEHEHRPVRPRRRPRAEDPGDAVGEPGDAGRRPRPCRDASRCGR